MEERTISKGPNAGQKMARFHIEDTTAQLRATGRLTRLCGPVNSSGLVAVSVPSGVQVIARRMETALAAALRLET